MIYRTKCYLFRIIKLAGFGALCAIAAAALLTLLFNAAVNYTFRYNPPTAEELAEAPELVRYVDK